MSFAISQTLRGHVVVNKTDLVLRIHLNKTAPFRVLEGVSKEGVGDSDGARD